MANETIFTNQVPSLPNASDNGTSYELGVKFQSAKTGQITAIRHWKAASETGTHIGRIWTSTGSLLTSVTFSNETASGWQQQALSTPLVIQANTTYVVSVNINSYFPDTYDALASAVVNGDLSTVADGQNGVAGNSGTFPTGSYRNSNYFRDVVFVPGVPPAITKISGDNQTGAAGTALPTPLVVQVTDNTGSPQAGATVSFAVTSGGGSVSPASAVTNANGQASTVLTLGNTPNTVNTVSATVSGIGTVTFNASSNPTATNAIYLENQNAGTTAWQLTNRATSFNEISGYAGAPSVNIGGSLSIYVAQESPGPYTIDVYRLGYYGGKGGRLMLSSGQLNGVNQPAPAITDSSTRLVECQWTVSYTLNVGSNWTTGVYVANLTDQGSGKQAQVWFVVRNDNSTANVLFQSSLNTYAAYNNYGGYSLYGYNSTNGQAAFKVSLDKPFAEVTNDFANYNQLTLWERNMIRWMESQSYDIAYVTNLDVHSNSQLLQKHKVFLSVGHDEYWSQEERNNVQQARDGSPSVNLAFFSGNSCYWRVRFDNSSTGVSNRVIVCYKDAYKQDPVAPTTNFRVPPNTPENALLGVMYTGSRDELYSGTNTSTPTYGGFDFVVANSSHRYYANTNLQDGNTLSGLVGFEWDAVVNNGSTPSGLVTLSQSAVNPSAVDNNLPSGTNTQISNSAAYTAASGAKVFAAGSIQWVWGVDSDGINPSKQDSRVQQIAVNILADMGAKPLTPSPNLVVPS